ncbi:MAG: Holliday junction resolvase-like protein [archaeon]
METLTSLILTAILVAVAFIFYKIGSMITNLKWKNKLPQFQKQTAEKQRSTIKGKLVEIFAPFLPNFPFKPSECKFIGDPIDYLVFEGLDERDIKAIHLLEVKDSQSKLSKHQKQIKEIIDNLKSNDVTFKEFRFKP